MPCRMCVGKGEVKSTSVEARLCAQARTGDWIHERQGRSPIGHGVYAGVERSSMPSGSHPSVLSLFGE